MEQTVAFGDILDAADQLSLEDQQALVDLLRRRIAERRREALARDAQEARDEFAAGKCQPASADEIMRRITS